MSTVCVLAPVVVGSWPVISAAIFGAAAGMGFATVEAHEAGSDVRAESSIDIDVPNSEVISDEIGHGQSIVIERDGVRAEFTHDDRGGCRICMTGRASKRELERIGQELAGRVVQQFAYHKLMSELKQRRFSVVDEKVGADQSIQVRVRLS